MGNTTNVNVRIDEKIKTQAEQIFSELGMTLSSATNMFLRAAVRCRGIPFELRLHEKPGASGVMSAAESDARTEQSMADAAAGKGRPAEEIFAEKEGK